MSQYIIIGKQGAAMDVIDRDVSKFVQRLYNISDSVHHITLLVNQGFTAKLMGRMMKKAKRSKWDEADNPLIFHSKDNAIVKILTTIVMNEDPREVEVTANQQVQLGEEIGLVIE
jgi:hypothetical protein